MTFWSCATVPSSITDLTAHNFSLINVTGRNIISLDGEWQIIIDPYEAGFYDYRHKESSYGFFRNETQYDKTQLIEYKYTPEHQLKVPGDWNSQTPKLLFRIILFN